MIPFSQAHTLLLRILTHDLLAPLTALKWQTELLAHKRELTDERLVTLEQSVAIGIALAKRTQIASLFLEGGYVPKYTTLILPKKLEEVCSEMHLQSERHGVMLECHLDEEKGERSIEGELSTLLVWAVVRFLLTLVTEKAHITMQGIASPEGVTGPYTLIIHADSLSNAEEALSYFKEGEGVENTDERALFAVIVREVVHTLDLSLATEVHDGVLTFDFAFPFKK